MLRTHSIILILCSTLSLLASSLSPTLEKSFFFIESGNNLSQELFQTRNGIISHTVEDTGTKFISQYFLINIPSRDTSQILTDTVCACETASPPVFQHLHYHVATDSLVYFCAANSSLFLIDQSSYTIQSEIPLNANNNISWPLASFSTDGMNVGVLAMDTLFDQSQASALFTVNMQTRQLSAQILFNQSLMTGENVVAFATNKKGTYVATNRVIGGITLNTTVYSIIMIGSSYQLTPIKSFTANIMTRSIITKLYCLENYVIVNNDNQLNFINQQGSITRQLQVNVRRLHQQISTIQVPCFTSQSDSSYLYVDTISQVSKYSVVNGAIFSQNIGSFFGMQIAYGNSTSKDLILGSKDSSFFFTIIDLETLNIIAFAPTLVPLQTDLMLTNTTYAVVAQGYLMIFNLKTDALVAQIDLQNWNYYYNKDQQMISFLNNSAFSTCPLTHIDLASAKIWTTLPFTKCPGKLVNARITENGNAEAVFMYVDYYIIISETYGQLIFNKTKVFDSININYDDLSAYYLAPDNSGPNINASYYTFDVQSKSFQLQNSHMTVAESQITGLFAVNSTMSAVLSHSNSTNLSMNITLINGISDVFHANYSQNRIYSSASAFHDSEGKQYVIITGPYSSRTNNGAPPILLSADGSFMDLPGLRPDTMSAQATGPESFALIDAPCSSFGFARFYSVDSQAKQAIISI